MWAVQFNLLLIFFFTPLCVVCVYVCHSEINFLKKEEKEKKRKEPFRFKRFKVGGVEGWCGGGGGILQIFC